MLQYVPDQLNRFKVIVGIGVEPRDHLVDGCDPRGFVNMICNSTAMHQQIANGHFVAVGQVVDLVLHAK